jgi:hypothetical protein
MMRSVDDWPLAKDFARFLGVSRGQYPLSLSTDVTGRWYPPLEEYMLQSRGYVSLGTDRALWRTIPWGTQWGQLDGLMTGRFLAEPCPVGSDGGLRASFLLE